MTRTPVMQIKELKLKLAFITHNAGIVVVFEVKKPVVSLL